jgi:RNA polymerase sigma factor (sigma-70 family)
MGDHRMTSMAKSKQNRPSLELETSHRIPDCRRLTRNEEHELAGLVASGDVNARNEFVLANLPLVIKIARDYQGRGLALDDLVGEGNLGLIRATKEFRPSFGTRFSTYAAYWIKQSIRHALINTTTTIRLPAHMIRLLTKWRRAERTLNNERGETPRFDEVAAVLGLSESQKSLVRNARQALSFIPHSYHDPEPGNCDQPKTQNGSAKCEGTVEADEAHELLLQGMQRLGNRERTILELRYGLAGEEPLMLKEIGRRIGVTREWVRKIEIRALRQLRDNRTEITSDSKLRKRVRSKGGERIAVSASLHSRCRPGLWTRAISHGQSEL